MERSKRTVTHFFRGGVLLFSLLCLLLVPIKAEAALVKHSLSLNNSWVDSRLSDPEQVHFYTFTTPTTGYVELSFCSLASGQRWEFLNEDLQVPDWGWGPVLWETSPSNPKVSTEARWLDAGTYTVRVSCYSKDAVGDFRIRGSFRAAGNREQEPNQTYVQAQNTALGTEIRGLFTEQDLDDYYSFTLSRAQTISVQLKGYCSGIRVRLMDIDLKTLTSDVVWEGSESSPRVYEKEIALNAGKYYVHLETYSKDARGLYDYKVVGATVKTEEVRLNKTSVTLYEGDSTTLLATVSPEDATNKNVEWSTSKSSVATVDSNGRIIARKAGTAVITAKAADESGASASCEVIVKSKPEPKPEPIQKTLTVDKKSVKLYKNQKVSLKAVTTPAAKITFTSSNSKIAKVNKKGKITAVKKGKCKIYVRANGIQRTVNVQVKNPELKVEKSKIKLAVKKKHIIECSVKPAAKVTYQSSNKKIATVSKSGKIKAKRKGTCKIYVKAHGITKTIKLTVK